MARKTPERTRRLSTETDVSNEKPHWIEFIVWPRNGTMANAAHVRVDLRKPVKLYDDEHLSGYRVARSRAWQIARRMLEQSPSMPMCAEPHDWSDSVDQLSTNLPAATASEAA